MIDTSNGSGLKILDAESAVRKAIESGGWSDEMEISVPGINVREILTNYYRTNLIPRYGKVPERMEILLSEWKASDLEGLIGYEVYDFDKDGQDEMVLEPGEIDHSESTRNDQSRLIRNSQCTSMTN